MTKTNQPPPSARPRKSRPKTKAKKRKPEHDSGYKLRNR
jgi:hypothetical protein